MSGCPFCQKGVSHVDYKDVGALRAVLKPDGSIPPRRTASRRALCRRHQSQLAVAVKRARFMALLPIGPPPKVILWPPKQRRRT